MWNVAADPTHSCFLGGEDFCHVINSVAVVFVPLCWAKTQFTLKTAASFSSCFSFSEVLSGLSHKNSFLRKNTNAGRNTNISRCRAATTLTDVLYCIIVQYYSVTPNPVINWSRMSWIRLFPRPNHYWRQCGVFCSSSADGKESDGKESELLKSQNAFLHKRHWRVSSDLMRSWE